MKSGCTRRAFFGEGFIDFDPVCLHLVHVVYHVQVRVSTDGNNDTFIIMGYHHTDSQLPAKPVSFAGKKDSEFRLPSGSQDSLLLKHWTNRQKVMGSTPRQQWWENFLLLKLNFVC